LDESNELLAACDQTTGVPATGMVVGIFAGASAVTVAWSKSDSGTLASAKTNTHQNPLWKP
jgi:hypothetical protein